MNNSQQVNKQENHQQDLDLLNDQFGDLELNSVTEMSHQDYKFMMDDLRKNPKINPQLFQNIYDNNFSDFGSLNLSSAIFNKDSLLYSTEEKDVFQVGQAQSVIFSPKLAQKSKKEEVNLEQQIGTIVGTNDDYSQLDSPTSIRKIKTKNQKIKMSGIMLNEQNRQKSKQFEALNSCCWDNEQKRDIIPTKTFMFNSIKPNDLKENKVADKP